MDLPWPGLPVDEIKELQVESSVALEGGMCVKHRKVRLACNVGEVVVTLSLDFVELLSRPHPAMASHGVMVRMRIHIWTHQGVRDRSSWKKSSW
jgi:hypothetical protein